MPNARREIYAAARVEFTRLFVHVHDSAAFQNENDFLVGVVMERRFAGRNPSGELSDLPAAQIGVDKIPEDAIFACPNIPALGIFGATRADDAERLGAGVLDRVRGARRNEYGTAAAQAKEGTVDVTDT